ncbi:hypothetical protein F4553_000637 [Allocatelliglobosispora scoriae]|uniref:TIR domain-containing protein n=1 Tax=Allocatelliglobosispora scoriae TaxID=643052 RepID=A0A841BIV7_9ACTN|nr:hypothetical protein [Allocatelliglobosispora scoriae]MBB5867258.1 hypothetical protein [Allocatelliglobosispora scoriae]
MTQRFAAYFGVPSTQGQALSADIRALLAARGFLIRERAAVMSQFVAAVFEDDLVIIDATTDAGHLYGVITDQVQGLDHILVVSRTPLPVNLNPIREGGAPPYPRSRTNTEIVAWVTAQLNEMRFPGPLYAHDPSPEKLKSSFIRSVRMGITGFDPDDPLLRRLDESESRKHRPYGDRLGIFVSYRSGGSQVAAQRTDLLDRLSADVQRVAPMAGPFYFPPGALCYENELLTEQRHWMIANQLTYRIASAREFWILATPDYYRSWWTRMELLTVAQLRFGDGGGPRVRLVDPETLQFAEEPAGCIPEIDTDQFDTFQKLMSMASPSNMTAQHHEMVEFAGRWLRFVPTARFMAAYQSNRLLCCPRRLHLARDAFDVDTFLRLSQQPGVRSLTSKQLDRHARGGEFPCSSCGVAGHLTAGQPRYRWVSRTMTQDWDTVTTKPSLVEDPVWLWQHG